MKALSEKSLTDPSASLMAPEPTRIDFHHPKLVSTIIETSLAASQSRHTSTDGRSPSEERIGFRTFVRTNSYPIFVSFASAVGGLLFGYEIGIINQVLLMDSFRIYFGLSLLPPTDTTGRTYQGVLIPTENAADLEGNIVSLLLAGAILGSLFVWVFCDYAGRRSSLLFGTLGHIAGSCIQVASQHLWMLYLGRFVAGFGVGLISGVVPVYIAECAPSKIRGRMMALDQLMITIGILLSNVVNAILIAAYGVDGGTLVTDDAIWRTALGVQVVPAVVLLLLLVFHVLPESPRYLIMRGYYTKALTVLGRVLNMSPESPEMQEVYDRLLESINAEVRGIGGHNHGVQSLLEKPTSDWLDMLRDPGLRRRTAIAFLVFLFQQFSGINAVMYYSSSFFLEMGLSKNLATQVGTTIQSVINVAGTVISIYMIDNPRWGRRKMLLWGAIGCAIGMFSLVLWGNLFSRTTAGKITSAAMSLTSASASNATVSGGNPFDAGDDEVRAKAFGLLAMLSMYLYVACFAMSQGVVCWVLTTEIFPLRYRGKGATVAALSHWLWNFVIAKVWPFAFRLGPNQFLIFGVAILVQFVWVYYYVPNTSQQHLEDMDAIFGAVRRSSVSPEMQKITRSASSVLLVFQRARISSTPSLASSEIGLRTSRGS